MWEFYLISILNPHTHTHTTHSPLTHSLTHSLTHNHKHTNTQPHNHTTIFAGVAMMILVGESVLQVCITTRSEESKGAWYKLTVGLAVTLVQTRTRGHTQNTRRTHAEHTQNTNKPHLMCAGLLCCVLLLPHPTSPHGGSCSD